MISRGKAKLVSSEGRHRPALLETRERAAENKMLGSLCLMEEPKPAYMPFCLAWIFMQRNKIAISLCSSSEYGNTDTDVMRGLSS